MIIQKCSVHYRYIHEKIVPIQINFDLSACNAQASKIYAVGTPTEQDGQN